METILTNIGITKLASATPLDQLEIKWIRVGDGGGGYPPLDPAMTDLVNGVWAGPASVPIRDPSNPAALIFEAVIPATDGGFFIREVGLIDVDDDLIAIGQLSEIEKPTVASGSPITLTVRVRLVLSNESQTELIVTDAPIVDHQGLTNRDAPDAHPISSITNLESELNFIADRAFASLLKAQNLSDLESASDARDNLGLGTAAVEDAQEYTSDLTRGRLVKVGAFGLSGATSTHEDLNNIAYTGFFVCSNYQVPGAPDIGRPYFAAPGYQVRYSEVRRFQMLQIDKSILLFRSMYQPVNPGPGVWSDWMQLPISGPVSAETPAGVPGIYYNEAGLGIFIEWPEIGNETYRIAIANHKIMLMVSHNGGEFDFLDEWTSDSYFGNVLDTLRPYATTAQAQAATDNTKVMTPLRVKEAFKGTIVSGNQRHFQIPGGPLTVVGSATIAAGDGGITVTIPDMGNTQFNVVVTPKASTDTPVWATVQSQTSFRIYRQESAGAPTLPLSYVCYSNN